MYTYVAGRLCGALALSVCWAVDLCAYVAVRTRPAQEICKGSMVTMFIGVIDP